MHCSVDIETEGLDARKMILGCLKTDRKRTETFHSREALWEKVLELGEKEAKRKKNVFIYGHKHEYDFYGYADLNEKGITYISFRPFIARFRNIWFLDSMAIFPMALEKLGETIGMPKIKMPKGLEEGKCRNIGEIEEYCKRDTEIVLKAIIETKKKLNEEGIRVKKMMSIGQIAIRYIKTELSKGRWEPFLIREMNSYKTIPTTYTKEQERGYKGGRIEAFFLGYEKKATMIDVNSLYPWCISNMRIPDLRTETLTKNPMEKDTKFYKRIGVTKALLEKTDNKRGCIGIRHGKHLIFPSQKCLMAGTWTNLEIEHGLKNGYRLIDAEYSITYDDTENEFKHIFEELYRKRMRAGNELDNFFFKSIMNHAIGKFAQKRETQEMRVDSMSKAGEYMKKGFEVTGKTGYNFIYIKTRDARPSANYAIIIPSYVTATGRTRMHEEMKKICEKDLMYCANDGIMFRGNNKGKFDIGNKLGEFKIKGENKPALIYAKQTYMYGDEVRISGVLKRFADKGKFIKGEFTHKKMMGIKKGLENAGGFREETRNLQESMMKEAMRQEAAKQETVIIDEYETDIRRFKEKIVFYTRENNIHTER